MSSSWKKEKIHKSDLRRIGAISKPHGLHGAFFLHVESDLLDWLQHRPSFYLEIDGQLICSSVQSFKYSKNQPVLRLELLQSRTMVENHTGSPLYVLESEAREACDEDFFFNSDLVGCHIYREEDRDRDPLPEPVGIIQCVHESPAHNQLEVLKPDGTIFWLPFVGALILEVNLEDKIIIAHIPEGLEDLG